MKCNGVLAKKANVFRNKKEKAWGSHSRPRRGELCGGDSASGTESRGDFRKFGNRRETSKLHRQLHLVPVYTFESSVIVD